MVITNISDFDFELLEDAIALRPASPRDASRLLIVKPDAEPAFGQAKLSDLPKFLTRGDVLVFNNTRVLPAELHGTRAARDAGGPDVPISLTMIEPQANGVWKGLARPARRLRPGDMIAIHGGSAEASLIVRKKGLEGEVIVEAAHGESIADIMQVAGVMPLPPYISTLRDTDERDKRDYQTVYAASPGAVAAPTAGLHFTPELMQALDVRGVAQVFVTLHVGAGTFLPVKAETLEGHRLHPEWCEITEDAVRIINEARAKGGRLIAVGTTSLRLLETAARDDGTIAAYSGFTDLFIKPGYAFKTADVLLTNFHLPKSTLFMLVCAFSGTAVMRQAYAQAIASGFRFYSYGDACLLYRN